MKGTTPHTAQNYLKIGSYANRIKHRKNIASAITCTVPWRLTSVKPLENCKLEVEFIVDGTHGFVGVKQQIMGSKASVFGMLKDINIFNQVYME